MTKEDMKEKIQQLENENTELQSFLDNGKGSREKRAEFRAKIRANSREIMHLKSALICIRTDKLF